MKNKEEIKWLLKIFDDACKTDAKSDIKALRNYLRITKDSEVEKCEFVKQNVVNSIRYGKVLMSELSSATTILFQIGDIIADAKSCNKKEEEIKKILRPFFSQELKKRSKKTIDYSERLQRIKKEIVSRK